jgi:predicted ATPase
VAAEAQATQGDFARATLLAEKTYDLGKEDLEPENLERLYPLLLAGDSALSGEVKKQAKDYGLELILTKEEAKAHYFAAPTEGSPETRDIPNNLPRAKTSFVGRDPELVEVGQMLQQSDVRLITLLGPGGMGKTRLALQLAEGQLHENHFSDGIYFVALDALGDSEQIPLALVQTLNLKTKDEPLTAVRAAIGKKHMLLVLDNFEQLMSGVMLVSELLESCPGLKILVTSRERLNLEEEFVMSVQGLPLPDSEVNLAEVEYNDAVRLFVQRAKRARLEFTLTQETLPHVLNICKLVDGSPLGIELAAVWLRSLTPADLVREISKTVETLETPSRNIGERHQSLRAVFEHSWKLLKPKEQTTLARLTVFVAGFSREAAGHVCDATIPLLTSLVDKSLLRFSPEGRYDFHPLSHQYTKEKFAQGSDAETQTRAKHGHYFLTLVEASHKAGTQSRIKCCKDEYQNLLAALAWSQERDEARLGLRLGYALSLFWETQGYISEGRGWLKIVLAHPGAAEPTEERAKVLLEAAKDASWQAEHDLAQAYFGEALVISQTLSLGERAATAFLGLSLIAGRRGDHDKARLYAEEALSLARKLTKDELVAHALVHLATTFVGLDDYDKAQSLTEESIAVFRKLDLWFHVALNLNNLGFIAWVLGDLQAAKTRLEEAVTIAQSLPDLPTVCLARSNLGGVMLDLGNFTSALALARQALEFRWAQNDRWGLAYSLENFASLAVVQRDARRAAHLWGVAERLRQEINSPIESRWQAHLERFVAMAKSQLNEASFSALYQEGQRMVLGEAVNYALEVTDLALV